MDSLMRRGIYGGFNIDNFSCLVSKGVCHCGKDMGTRWFFNSPRLQLEICWFAVYSYGGD